MCALRCLYWINHVMICLRVKRFGQQQTRLSASTTLLVLHPLGLLSPLSMEPGAPSESLSSFSYAKAPMFKRFSPPRPSPLENGPFPDSQDEPEGRQDAPNENGDSISLGLGLIDGHRTRTPTRNAHSQMFAPARTLRGISTNLSRPLGVAGLGSKGSPSPRRQSGPNAPDQNSLQARLLLRKKQSMPIPATAHSQITPTLNHYTLPRTTEPAPPSSRVTRHSLPLPLNNANLDTRPRSPAFVTPGGSPPFVGHGSGLEDTPSVRDFEVPSHPDLMEETKPRSPFTRTSGRNLAESDTVSVAREQSFSRAPTAEPHGQRPSTMHVVDMMRETLEENERLVRIRKHLAALLCNLGYSCS